MGNLVHLPTNDHGVPNFFSVFGTFFSKCSHLSPDVDLALVQPDRYAETKSTKPEDFTRVPVPKLVNFFIRLNSTFWHLQCFSPYSLGLTIFLSMLSRHAYSLSARDRVVQ